MPAGPQPAAFDLLPGLAPSAHVPHALHAWMAVEKRTAAGGVTRLISKMPARFWCETISDNEGGAQPREIEARIFPNSAKELYQAQKAA